MTIQQETKKLVEKFTVELNMFNWIEKGRLQLCVKSLLKISIERTISILEGIKENNENSDIDYDIANEITHQQELIKHIELL